MKIKSRSLNKNETFCCSMKAAKEIFKDTEIKLDFAFAGRDLVPYHNDADYKYIKNHVKGIIVAESHMYDRVESELICFAVVKQSEITPEIKRDFEQNFLPEYYKLYMEKLNSKILIPKTTVLLTELYDGKLKLHKFDIK